MSTELHEPKPSIISNFLFSTLSTFLTILIPLLTYPYVARILGPENLGRTGIASSFTNYFIAAAQIGLPVYGVRLVAQRRSDKKALERAVSELVQLSIASSFLAILAFSIAVMAIPKYRSEWNLFLVFGLTIMTSAMNMDWLFQGMERFRYIGVRNAILQVLFVVSLFLFVRKASDYIVYAFLFFAVGFATMIINYAVARRNIKLGFKDLSPLKHIGSISVITLFSFLVTAYTNLDFLFLSLFSRIEEAGFYSISIRIARIVIAFMATLSTVLMPRLSTLAETDKEESTRLLQNSFSAIALFVIPAAFGLVAIADDLIKVFAGAQFTPAATSMRITAWIIPIVAFSNALQMQILIPQQKEKSMLVSFSIGILVTGLVLCFTVKPFGQAGAAMGMLVGEASVLVAHTYFCGKKAILTIFARKRLFHYLAGGVLCGLVAYCISQLSGVMLIARLILAIAISAFFYFIFLLVVKDDFAILIIKSRHKNTG